MPPTTVITPRLGLGRYFADLRTYGELMIFLAGRDLAVRYKQTFAGVLWAVLVPLLTVLALSFVFGRVAKLEGSTLLMVYAGMIPWQFFATALQNGGTSLLSNTNLVTKLYFPRLILPLSSLAVAFVDLLLNLLLFVGIGLFFGHEFSWRLATLPAWILLAAFASLGPVLITAAALVRYRDLRFLIPFVIQFGLFVTPVGYAAAVVPERWQAVFNLNPLVGPIEGLRWAMMNTPALPMEAISSSLIVSAILLLIGGALFIRAEATMADEL